MTKVLPDNHRQGSGCIIYYMEGKCKKRRCIKFIVLKQRMERRASAKHVLSTGTRKQLQMRDNYDWV